MKRGLIFLALLSLCSTAQAGIISYDQFASSTTIVQLNTAMNTAYNAINGGISSANITNLTIVSEDIAASANPIVRDNELIGDIIYTGLLPVTSTDLTSNISAGTCYVNGNRIVKDATAKTYTASKDTWVFIDQNGAYSYSAVNNSAAQPDTPTNSVLLAKVVTDTDNITSVTDYRQLTPSNLRIYQDYIQGCVLSRDAATATKISIDVGEIELGNTSGKVRRNTAPVYVDLSTTGRGALDTGTLAAGYYYLHAISDDANSTNYEAIGSTSRTSPTGYSGTRLIGWCYANSASNISPDSVGAYRGKGGDAPNIAKRQSIENITIDDTAYGTDFDATSMRMFTSGRPIMVTGQINMLNPAGDPGMVSFTVNIDGVSVDSSESSTYVIASGGAKFSSVPISCFTRPGVGEHTIKIQGKVAASSAVVDAFDIRVIEF